MLQQAHSPTLMVECQPAPARQPSPTQRVSLDDELELHIEDCEHQYLIAYERFRLWGNPHDRDEALLHLHRMNEAILSRSPTVQAARHAEFERRLDEGVDYFSVAGARDRAAMEGRA